MGVDVKLLHDKSRSKIRYTNAIKEFEKAAKAHADQATFKKTTTHGTKKKRRYPTIYVGSNQRLTLQGDVKAVEIESAILSIDSSAEPRLADVPDNKSSDKIEELEEEHENLRRELSDLKSQMTEMQDIIKKMHEQEDETEEDMKDTDDRVEDLFEEAGLNEPEL